MPQTRDGAHTGADDLLVAKENQLSSTLTSTSPSKTHGAKPPTTIAKKRKSALDEPSVTTAKSNKRISTGKPTTTSTSTSAAPQAPGIPSPSHESEETKKPRLSIEDLQFDWDRTQLRDPRPTPGRIVRPRYGYFDIPQDLKAHLEATREIPGPPPRPKGRLTNAVKNDMFVAEARVNPLQSFHDLYKCYDKGRDGSPTYDEAGFQLDYDKVANWMRPKAYNKKSMVNGMERRLARGESETAQMFDLFFVESGKAKETEIEVKHYVADHVSKDLGIPLHQIGPKEVKMWREKGFKPVWFEDWWKKPTAEERKRQMKMLGGASLRKHL